MGRRKSATSSSGDKAKSEWFKSLLSAVIGGILVLAGQIIVNPIVAKRVKIQESITQKRYEACEKAIDLLQRRLASTTITGKPVPEWYKPSEEPPTQLEMNAAYARLAIYGKSQTIAEEFFAATGPGPIEPKDVVRFVSTVRKELGIDDKDFTEYRYRLLPIGDEHEVNDVEANSEQ